MATFNIDRSITDSQRQNKSGVTVYSTTVSGSEIETNDDTYRLVKLPEKIALVSAAIIIKVASTTTTSAVVDLAIGSTSLLANSDLTSAVGTRTEYSTLRVFSTGGHLTLHPTYVGDNRDGEFYILVQFIEMDKRADGEVFQGYKNATSAQ